MSQLLFHENKHIYEVDGMEIPSVTELCSIFGNDINDPFFENAMEIAADRGVTCHKVLELILSGENIDNIEYPDIYSEYIESILLFISENKIEPLFIENRIYSPIIMVAGTPDLLCMFNGKLTIIDYKFVSQVCKSKVKAQLGGYDRIFEDNGVNVDQLLCVQFTKNKYRIYNVSMDGIEFDLALKVHQIKQKKHARGEIN